MTSHHPDACSRAWCALESFEERLIVVLQYRVRRRLAILSWEKAKDMLRLG